jgi:hypothetical protein
MLHMFHTYVARVLSGCCVCLQWFLIVFSSVLDACFKCFICLFLLRVLHLNVSKVDRVMRVGSGRGARAVPWRQRSGVAGPPAWVWVTQARSSNVGRRGPMRGRVKRGENWLQPWTSVRTSGRWRYHFSPHASVPASVTHRQRVRLHQLDAPRQARSDRAPTLCRSAGELCFNFQSDHGGQEVLIEHHHSCNRIRCALWI